MPGRPSSGLWSLGEEPCAFPRSCPLPPKEPVRTRGRESRAGTGGQTGWPGSLGAQPTHPASPPLPWRRASLDRQSYRRQPHVVPPVGAAGERGGGRPGERSPAAGYPAEPRAPGTRDSTRQGPARKDPMLKPQMSPSRRKAKLRPTLSAAWGQPEAFPKDQTEAGTALTLPRTPTTRTARPGPTGAASKCPPTRVRCALRAPLLTARREDSAQQRSWPVRSAAPRGLSLRAQLG